MFILVFSKLRLEENDGRGAIQAESRVPQVPKVTWAEKASVVSWDMALFPVTSVLPHRTKPAPGPFLSRKVEKSHW